MLEEMLLSEMMTVLLRRQGLALATSCVPLAMQWQRLPLPVALGQWPPPAHSRDDQQAAGEHLLFRAGLLPLPTTVLPIESLLGCRPHPPVPPAYTGSPPPLLLARC